MTFTFEQPPERLTGYHLPWLLDAEAGTLTYDKDRWRVHGVSNNARALELQGLLAYGPDGMVLTDLGRTMLADWKASPEGQQWLADWDFGEEAEESARPSAAPAHDEQLGLFTEVAR